MEHGWYRMMLYLSLCVITQGIPQAYGVWRGERNPHADGPSPLQTYPFIAPNEPPAGKHQQRHPDNIYGKQLHRRSWYDTTGEPKSGINPTNTLGRYLIQNTSNNNIAARIFGAASPREYGIFDRPPTRQYNGGLLPPLRQYDIFDRPPPRQYDGGMRPPVRTYNTFDRPPPREYGTFDRPPPREYGTFDRPPPRQYGTFDIFNRPPPRQYGGGSRPPVVGYDIFVRPPVREYGGGMAPPPGELNILGGSSPIQYNGGIRPSTRAYGLYSGTPSLDYIGDIRPSPTGYDDFDKR